MIYDYQITVICTKYKHTKNYNRLFDNYFLDESLTGG